MTAIVWDFDGVIGDTLDLNLGIIREEGLFPGITREDYVVRHHMGDVHVHPTLQFTDEKAQLYNERYRDELHVGHIAKAREHLLALSKDFKMHILTSNNGATIHQLFVQAGIRDIINDISGGQGGIPKKGRLETLCERNGLDLERIVYVCDTVGDVRVMRQLGVQTVAVTFGYHTHDALKREAPHAIARNWHEVRHHVNVLLTQ